MKSIIDLKINEEAEINGIAPDHEFALRLSQLGVTIGQKIKLLGYAPFGDPVRILVHDTVLGIRKKDAARIFLL